MHISFQISFLSLQNYALLCVGLLYKIRIKYIEVSGGENVQGILL